MQKERGAEKPNLKKREGSNERDVNTNVEKNKPSIIIPTKKKKKNPKLHRFWDPFF